jgi:shikimate kinase
VIAKVVKMDQPRIYLLGFMGSGKSYTGRKLAARLGLPYIDLDQMIEKRAGKTITALFEEHGETGFRQFERETLLETGKHLSAVISCGGGVPCFLENIDWINQHGTSVYLKTSPEILFQRLKNGRQQRPLLRGKTDEELKSYIVEKLKERETFYNQAQLILEQNSNEAMSEKIIEALHGKLGFQLGPAGE